jgi:hypothetical protein
VTCTKDDLRRHGLSADHFHYLAHGLPVVAPAGGKDVERLRGTIAYEEETFRPIVDGLSDESRWRRLSNAAHEHAQALAWDGTLRPLKGSPFGSPDQRSVETVTSSDRA